MNAKTRKLCLENLETRTLMAADFAWQLSADLDHYAPSSAEISSVSGMDLGSGRIKGLSGTDLGSGRVVAVQQPQTQVETTKFDAHDAVFAQYGR